MSIFSRYTRSKQGKPLLSVRRVLGVLAGAAALLGFGLGQLHLKFAVDDLRRETSRLQTRKMELMGQINIARTNVERYKQGDRLLQYATAKLGMVEYTPTEQEHITIAADIQEQYADYDIIIAGWDDRDRNDDESKAWAEALASRLVLAGAAFAGENEE